MNWIDLYLLVRAFGEAGTTHIWTGELAAAKRLIKRGWLMLAHPSSNKPETGRRVFVTDQGSQRVVELMEALQQMNSGDYST